MQPRRYEFFIFIYDYYYYFYGHGRSTATTSRCGATGIPWVPRAVVVASETGPSAGWERERETGWESEREMDFVFVYKYAWACVRMCVYVYVCECACAISEMDRRANGGRRRGTFSEICRDLGASRERRPSGPPSVRLGTNECVFVCVCASVSEWITSGRVWVILFQTGSISRGVCARVCACGEKNPELVAEEAAAAAMLRGTSLSVSCVYVYIIMQCASIGLHVSTCVHSIVYVFSSCVYYVCVCALHYTQRARLAQRNSLPVHDHTIRPLDRLFVTPFFFCIYFIPTGHTVYSVVRRACSSPFLAIKMWTFLFLVIKFSQIWNTWFSWRQ